MDGKKKLEELVAGLDGVSPGPWRLGKNGEWSSIEDNLGTLAGGLTGTDAAHIARCDPDTIRSISDAYKAMEAERDALLKAAEAVIASWDDRLPDGPEEIRSFEAGGKTTKYWSPTGSMVDSPAIASLRAVLKGARHEG